MTAWEPGDLDLSHMQCDVGFMEAINQSMQVPSRLKVADESIRPEGAEIKDDPPPSFHMKIPDRISFVGMTDVRMRPLLIDQGQGNSLLHAYDTTVSPAESLFLMDTAKSGTQKHQKKASKRRSRKEQSESEHTALTVRTVDQQPYRQEKRPTSAPHFPSFTQNGKIYSLQNVCRTVRFLGCLLSHRLQESLHSPSLPRLRDVGSESSNGRVEELGMLEVAALRKQLNKISGRLQILEEEKIGRHQKEVLVFSVLLTACFINAWLWLRR